ncbi:uncharacterized protein LOC131876662 [Cryptomeria japonica]|uniref:uncharacterized protein LOC131876662 n=1 Tax=Cryptomeria japonica TaxID=3369 RepID=UPI0027DA4FAA|nr:uncharacterized protein LOC131876662 [Cryptomeria japonica]
METFEPRIVWILPMGYEVDEITLDTYAQHLLSKLVDENKERFGTFKEKDLSLHKQFTKCGRKRKVRKEVEQLAEQMGITKEVVQRAREKNILEEDMVKNKYNPIFTPPKKAKAKQSKSTPTSGVQKVVPPPKPQSSSTDGAEKRKKEKPVRTYVIAEEETKLDEKVREVKETIIYARVVRNPPSGEAQLAKKPKTEGDPSGKAKPSKKKKSKLDEAFKLGKLEVPYTLVPLKSLDEIINEIKKEGNLKNLPIYYENYDDKDQKAIEEINLEKDNSQLEGQSSKDTSTLVVHAPSKVSHDRPSMIDLIEYEVADDTTDNQVVGDSGESMQDPLVMEVHFEEATAEIRNKKGVGEKAREEVDAAKVDTGASVGAEKEKGEEKVEEAPVTIAKPLYLTKGSRLI